MSTKVAAINQTTFRILYLQYKVFFLPGIVFLLGVCLLIVLVIPEFQQYKAAQDEIAISREKIALLNQNIALVSRQNTGTLDKDLQIVAKAIPVDKDFTSILNAISDAAVDSNTSLGDYSFQVGVLSQQQQNTKDTNLQLSLVVNGYVKDIRNFLVALKTKLPLSDVSDLRINGSNASMTLIFPYKPLPRVVFRPDQQIQSLTSQDETLLKSFEKEIHPSAEGIIIKQ